ncbi:MAG: LPS assembly protein LptD [Rickettsiales bacterium]|nr:LPS assembly protein LptD [Rickettsiales bacterium]
MRNYNKNFAVVFSLAILFASTSVSSAKLDYSKSQEKPKTEIIKKVKKPEPKASLEAGNLYYDVNSKVLTATDKVDIRYQDKQLKAEKIVYDRKTEMISAETGVVFTSAQGTNFKASELVTNDKFTRGVLKDVEGKLEDGSILKSKKVKILGEKKYQLTDSFYSPCKPCDGKYLWRVRSKNIVYDEDDGKVYYKDAYMDILNRPFGYTPYLSHPTPFAKSKSGFLTPSFGSSGIFGTFLEVPYYYQPKQNMDFTLRPRYMTFDGLMLQTQMRHLLYDGYYQLDVGGIYTDGPDDLSSPVRTQEKGFRGHVFGFGNYQFEDDWEFLFDARRSTDDTYLRRYNIDFQDWLTSEARLERFKDEDRKYFVAKTLSFQGLRVTDDPDITPFVLPIIEAGKTYKIDDEYNQKLNLDVNSMVLRRSRGAQSTRIVGKTSYNASHTLSNGQLFTLDTTARADYYNVDEVLQANNVEYQGGIYRIVPETSLTWEYPFINQFSNYNLIFSPIVMGIVSPNGINDSRIPNEDSQGVELQDYNLFQEHHISGLDILESGARVNYGLRSVISGEDFGDVSVLVGQNYRATTNKTTLGLQSGLADNFSDYVGRVSIYNNKHIFTNYRFRLDKDNFKFKRNEAGIDINYQPVILGIGYTFVDNSVFDRDRQEVYGNASYAIDNNWSILTNARRNMDNDTQAGWVNIGSGLSYTHDCVTTTLSVNRDLTRDRDIEPSTEILLQLNFANLGT